MKLAPLLNILRNEKMYKQMYKQKILLEVLYTCTRGHKKLEHHGQTQCIVSCPRISSAGQQQVQLRGLNWGTNRRGSVRRAARATCAGRRPMRDPRARSGAAPSGPSPRTNRMTSWVARGSPSRRCRRRSRAPRCGPRCSSLRERSAPARGRQHWPSRSRCRVRPDSGARAGRPLWSPSKSRSATCSHSNGVEFLPLPWGLPQVRKKINLLILYTKK